MTIANLRESILKSMEFVEAASLDLQYRRNEKDFTRKRLLPFNRVVALVLSAMKRPLDLELKVAFEILNLPVCPTDSAFSQARKKLLSKFFADWIDHQARVMYEYPHETFMGLRLIAVDGTVVAAPDNAATRDAFGCVVNTKGVASVQARLLCCHDVLNNHAVATRIAPYGQSEVNMAFDCVGGFGSGHLMIYDRLFLGWGLIRMHQLKGVEFLMRCTLTANNVVKAFVKSGEAEQVVQFKATGKSASKLRDLGIPAKTGELLTVRLVRVCIGGKEPEVLATSLIDPQKYPHAIFKELYFKRWKVETFFDRLKNKLKAAVFSGLSGEVVKQDLLASVFLANLQSMIERANRQQVAEVTKGREHPYQINWNKNLGLLKPRVPILFAPGDQGQALADLMQEMAKPRYLEPVRKGRQFSHVRKVRNLNSRHRPVPNYKHVI